MKPRTRMIEPVTHMSAHRRLQLALGLGLTYVAIVFTGALLSGSLALMADSAHMLAHSLALGIAIFASFAAQRSRRRGLGESYQRIEALGGYTNGLLLLAIALLIGYEGIQRILELPGGHHGHAHGIDAKTMGAVAVVGLGLHAASAVVLYGGRNENLNIHALFLHIFFDVAATFVALATSVLIHMTGDEWLDGAASLLIAALILFSASRMIAKGYRLLAGSAPPDISHDKIGAAVLEVPHVTGIHHIIVQPLHGGALALSAHLVLDADCIGRDHWMECRGRVEALLRDRFAIGETVLQLEFENEHKDHDHGHAHD